jgi:hypothetical protein
LPTLFKTYKNGVKKIKNGYKRNKMDKQEIIIYKTADGNTSVSLYALDGNIWLNQN